MSTSFQYIPNPYSTGMPIHDSAMFYGREDEISYLKDNLTHTQINTMIFLHGQRRSGKTSLLYYLTNTETLYPHVPVFMDIQNIYNFSFHKFLFYMASAIFRAMKKRSINTYLPTVQDFNLDPIFTFENFLEEVTTQLGEKKIILLIDEFELLEEMLTKSKAPSEMLPYLRSLIQHHSNINILFSGAHAIRELSVNYWSVFFDIGHHYRLSHLSKEGAISLITKPVVPYLIYDQIAIEKIRDLTADQAHLIHRMCRSLVDYCNLEEKCVITAIDVNIVASEFLQTDQFYFSWRLENISRVEQIILAILADGGREEGHALSFSQIEQIYQIHNRSYKRNVILAACKSLIDMDLVTSEGKVPKGLFEEGQFRISAGLVRRWLIKEKPFELVIREELHE